MKRNDTNEETARIIRALEPPRKSEIVVCDLSQKEQVRSLAERIVGSGEGSLGRRVDVLVNCGGIQRRYVRLVSGRLNIEVIAPYRHKAEVFPDDDWEEVRLFRTPSWERLTLSVLVFRYYK